MENVHHITLYLQLLSMLLDIKWLKVENTVHLSPFSLFFPPYLILKQQKWKILHLYL